MNYEKYKCDCITEFGVDEETLVQMVRETLKELNIPYEDIPGNFVLGEKMFDGSVLIEHNASIFIPPITQKNLITNAYALANTNDISTHSCNMKLPVCSYSAAGPLVA